LVSYFDNTIYMDIKGVYICHKVISSDAHNGDNNSPKLENSRVA